MAIFQEDASSVLEQFVNDESNVPAEICHLLEEIGAKDKDIYKLDQEIAANEQQIQKFGKQHGFGVHNPKEEGYMKTISANHEKAKVLQSEKCALAEKAQAQLDRAVRRLDVQIKALEDSGVMAPDPELPSMLRNSIGNKVPAPSIPTTGTTTPLNPTTGNTQAHASNAINNAAVARLMTQQATVQSPRHHSPVATGPATPNTAANSNIAQLSRSARESSLETKRRRLANQPATSSNLRQSSLGPTSTPKASTPGASARAGSAGPRAGSAKPSKGGVGLKGRSASSLNPASASKKGGSRRKGYRKGLHGIKPSPSDGDDSALSEVGDSETERGSQAHRSASGVDGANDVEMGGMEDDDEDGGDGDDKKYCFCRSVSYGNMVGCDNEGGCEFEWFHWGCVGMTKEPMGKWYCDACKVKLGIKEKPS